MTVTINEIWEKEDFTLVRGNFFHEDSSCTKTFVVDGVSTEAEACSLAYYAADRYIATPDGELSIPRHSASIAEKCGESRWKVSVEYRYLPLSDENTRDGGYDSDDDGTSHGRGYNDQNKNVVTHSFDCTASTLHLTTPLAQWCRWSSVGGTQDTPCPGIPIGMPSDEEGEPAGVDIVWPQVTEKYTKTFPIEVVLSTAWKRKMIAFHRCVNMGSYHGYDTGEVLFLGCSYNTPLVGSKTVSVDFNFSIIENDYNASFAGHLIGNVCGHDYVWAKHKQDANGIKVVDAVFVSQVYVYRNLSLLGV